MDNKKLKFQPKYYGVATAMIAMLGMYLILTYNKCMNDEYSILGGDLLLQYIPYIKMFLCDILNGESIWYSWSTSMGMNTSLINAYYVFSPFNIFYLIFWNVDEGLITSIIIILKSGLASYAFFVFSTRVIKCKGVQTILFAFAYALSMYAICYCVFYPSWSDGIILLPLICTWIYELENRNSNYLKLILSYTILFVSQFYIGYMVGIFSFLFWLVLQFVKEKFSFRIFLRNAFGYFGSVILSIGISAFFLLPAFIFLINNGAADIETFEEFKANVFEILYALFWGSGVTKSSTVPALYCGWPVLLLFPLYFFNKNIKVREKIGYGILVFFLVLTILVKPFYQFIHAFDAPNFFYNRQTFLLIFLICALATKQSIYIETIKKRDLIIVLVCYAVLYPIVFWLSGMEYADFILRLIVNVLGALLWYGIWFLYNKKQVERKSIALLAVILLLIELFTNGLCSFDKSEYYKYENYSVWKEGITSAVEEVRSDTDYYRMYYNIDMSPNSDSWFGYNGVSDFSSVENYTLRLSMQKLGVCTSQKLLAPVGAGMMPPIETLLGVKYIVTGPNPNFDLSGLNFYKISENNYRLNIGYMVSDAVIDYEMYGTNSFENINFLLQTMSGRKENCFEPYIGEVIIECDQIEGYIGDESTIIQYDAEQYTYGKLSYSISNENVKGPLYIQIPNETSSLKSNVPFLLGGYENVFKRYAGVSVSYIKPLLNDENCYTISVYMDDETVNAWLYNNPLFYEYNEDALAAIHENLSQSQLQVEEYADGYVKGTVDVPTEKTVLFTSIPYDEGWTAYVDGAEWETIAVVGDAFMALELEPGHHEVEFTYEAPGVKEGILVSSVSVGIYAALIVLYCVTERKKRRKKDESEQ